MRLRDLNARFLKQADPASRSVRLDDGIEGAQGVIFQCPRCAAGKEIVEEEGRRFVRGVHSVRIFFSNPFGVAVAPQEVDDNPRWEVSGSCIDDLTLSPSVNLDLPENGPDCCRWHGWVKSGDAA
jgi:hypothetical protein